MADQTIIQVRVDNELKEQVAAIYDRIGIDIPTAVRMFFKATVRDDDLPFSTKGKAEPTKEPTQAEQLMQYFKGIVMYESPLASSDDTVVVLPLENGYEIPTSMYAQLVDIVPAGKITCWEDIFAFLGKLYNKEVSYPERSLPRIDTANRSIPYWRVVSKQGVLGDGRGGNKETQKEQLVKEGIPVVQRGSIAGSYKVQNYKEYMFNFDRLKVVRE